jgi:hypothetical protein
MSFAPTQREPAICGNQVRGLLRNTVANSTGIFRRNSTPSTTQRVKCKGKNGVGGMNAISSPKENARMTLVRLKCQQPRSTTTDAKGFRHQSFSSAWRSGVMRLSQRCMILSRLPRRHYAVSVRLGNAPLARALTSPHCPKVRLPSTRAYLKPRRSSIMPVDPMTYVKRTQCGRSSAQAAASCGRLFYARSRP